MRFRIQRSPFPSACASGFESTDGSFMVTPNRGEFHEARGASRGNAFPDSKIAVSLSLRFGL
jgi:hypothetical protein